MIWFEVAQNETEGQDYILAVLVSVELVEF
jgi:hypothetical protein